MSNGVNMDLSSVSVEVLSKYTALAISDLEKRGESISVESITKKRDSIYTKDLEIASIANGMKVKKGRVN